MFAAGEARRRLGQQRRRPRELLVHPACRSSAGATCVVTVGTGGPQPGAGAWLRRQLEDELGPEYETLLDLLAEARDELRAAGRSTEDLDWQRPSIPACST